MCMTTTPASHAAATSTISGSRKPETSLMIDAPASTHAFATGACRVSIETAISSAESRWTTGLTRASSSASSSWLAPGLVDSPPTSIT